MRLVFMGSPDFAVPSLRAVARAGHDVTVVTQPPKRSGRGRKTRQTPVAEAAGEMGLRVLAPLDVNSREALGEVEEARPEMIVVVAYGQILRGPLLKLPPLGCVNAHASLLPRWRGASPISAAIAAGDRRTGVTLIRMGRRLDAGPVLARQPVPVSPEETAGSLHDTLSSLSAACLLAHLRAVEAGDAPEDTPQDEAAATYAPKIGRDDARIRWGSEARLLERHVRAMYPWPGAFCLAPDGRSLRILRAKSMAGQGPAPGSVTRTREGDMMVAAGQGYLVLIEVQPESGRPMSGRAYMTGHPVDGAILR